MSPDYEADVVVVGYGGAGAATILRAAELGGSVLVLEKQREERHTPSTRMSGAHIMCVNDVDRAAVYFDQCAAGSIPFEVSYAWAEKARTTVEWLDGLGTDLNLQRAYGGEFPHFDGYDAIDVYLQAKLRDGTSVEFTAPQGGGIAGPLEARDPEIRKGAEFFTALTDAVGRCRDIEIVWNAPAERLVRDSDGRVTDVVFSSNGVSKVARGRKGVVLTTGGFDQNEAMKLNFLKAPNIHFYGNPDNTGDGVRMAQAVGADLWHMQQMIGGGVAHFTLEDGTPVTFQMWLPHGVWLDRHGRRFTNEARQMMGVHDTWNVLVHYDPQAGEYPRIPSYWVFDERLGRKQLATRGIVEFGYYDWSPDNSVEIERGWIHVGDTMEQLAVSAGMTDPEGAAAAVAEYNEICARGFDPLGRPADMLEPIEGPPYYCIPLYPGGASTQGGPRRNQYAQIVDSFGAAIPGLFAAGALGTAYGLHPPSGGSNISDAMCFSRIAAESALSGVPEVHVAGALR